MMDVSDNRCQMVLMVENINKVQKRIPSSNNSVNASGSELTKSLHEFAQISQNKHWKYDNIPRAFFGF